MPSIVTARKAARIAIAILSSGRIASSSQSANRKEIGDMSPAASARIKPPSLVRPSDQVGREHAVARVDGMLHIADKMGEANFVGLAGKANLSLHNDPRPSNRPDIAQGLPGPRNIEPHSGRTGTNAPDADAKENCAAALTVAVKSLAPWRLVAMHALPGFRPRVRFNDGTEGTVEMARFLASAEDGVLVALRDEALFRQVRLDTGAVTWPGNLDLAPDAMHRAIKERRSRVL